MKTITHPNGKPVTRAEVVERFAPKVSPFDFFMGHRYCTYNEDGSAALHTDSLVSVMNSKEPWAWDNKTKKWAKRP